MARGRSSVDDRKLLRLLKRLPDEMAAPIKAAVAATAQAVLEDAQATVPVKTGALRKSIKKRKTKGGFGATVSTKSPYGHLVELGTRPHSLGTHGHHPGAVAKPYLHPALAKNRTRGKDSIAKAVNSGIKKAAAGA